jgi:hypothetical protein
MDGGREGERANPEERVSLRNRIDPEMLERSVPCFLLILLLAISFLFLLLLARVHTLVGLNVVVEVSTAFQGRCAMLCHCDFLLIPSTCKFLKAEDEK